MPRFGTLNEGKYLKKEDFPQPALLTIREWKRENVARENDQPEFKWICYFHENIGDGNHRGLIVNPTNEQLIQLATGKTGTDETIGLKVVLYNDPTISMGGKLVGGIRIRAPRNQAPANRPGPAPVGTSLPAPEPEPSFPGEGPVTESDDVPF